MAASRPRCPWRHAASSLPMLLACACLLLLRPAASVQPKELEDWFASSQGLALARPEAEALAAQQWQVLTQCGVTVPKLQALKDVMYDHKGMDVSMQQLRSELLPLAEQHAAPEKLGRLYTALSSGYTISGGLALDKAEAQLRAVDLVRHRAEPDELYALYRAMYGYGGLGFDQKSAQQTSIQLALAGADAGRFEDAYKQAKAKGASGPAATTQAAGAAVASELSGLVRRYAKDAKPYTAAEFQQYYGQRWLDEWLAAPMELRVSSDRLARTASQFAKHYGSQWQDRYSASAEATQKRLAGDAKAYSMQEFQGYYGDSWQSQWASAPELPCSQCAPYAALGLADLLLV